MTESHRPNRAGRHHVSGMPVNHRRVFVDMLGDADAIKVEGCDAQLDAFESLISATHVYDERFECWTPAETLDRRDIDKGY